MTPLDLDSAAIAEQIAALALHGELTVTVAESLTSGQLAAALGAAPNASEWFLGAVVAYTHRVKYDVLGVPQGPVVTAEAASAMATGVRRLTMADVSVAVTGAGGPDSQDGQPPGTVFIATCSARGTRVTEHHFRGDPADVVQQTIMAGLGQLLEDLPLPDEMPRR